MPRSSGLMRPSGETAVASVKTSAAPPTARLPRCTKCQSVAKPSTLEYSHIGETMIRLDRVRPLRTSGSKRCATHLILWDRLTHADVMQKRSAWNRHDSRARAHRGGVA